MTAPPSTGDWPKVAPAGCRCAIRDAPDGCELPGHEFSQACPWTRVPGTGGPECLVKSPLQPGALGLWMHIGWLHDGKWPAGQVRPRPW